MISAFDSLPSSALSPRQNLVSLRSLSHFPVQSSPAQLTTHNITIVPRHTQRLFLPSPPRIYRRLRLHKRSKIVYSPGFGFCSGSPSARSHEISASRSLFSPLFLFFSLLRNSIRISQTSGAGGLPSRSTEKFCLSLPLLLDPVYPASLDLITSREPPLSKTISQKMFMFPPKHFLFSSFEINAQPFSLSLSLCVTLNAAEFDARAEGV